MLVFVSTPGSQGSVDRPSSLRANSLDFTFFGRYCPTMKCFGRHRFWFLMLLVTFGVSGWATLGWVGGGEATLDEEEPVAMVRWANSPGEAQRAAVRRELGTGPSKSFVLEYDTVRLVPALGVPPRGAGKSRLQFISLRRE